jgi:hypothetical protein
VNKPALVISLHSFLADAGILSPDFDKLLDECNFSESQKIKLKRHIAILITKALIESGNSVIKDFNCESRRSDRLH